MYGPVTVKVPIVGELILAELQAIKATLEVIVSNQEELNARAASLQAGVDALQLAVDGVQQAIDDLKAANPALDFSALDAAMGNLGTTTTDLQASDTGAPGVDPVA